MEQNRTEQDRRDENGTEQKNYLTEQNKKKNKIKYNRKKGWSHLSPI